MTGKVVNFPDYGRQVVIEQHEREIHMILVAADLDEANHLYEVMKARLTDGEFALTFNGMHKVMTEIVRED